MADNSDVIDSEKNGNAVEEMDVLGEDDEEVNLVIAEEKQEVGEVSQTESMEDSQLASEDNTNDPSPSERQGETALSEGTAEDADVRASEKSKQVTGPGEESTTEQVMSEEAGVRITSDSPVGMTNDESVTNMNTEKVLENTDSGISVEKTATTTTDEERFREAPHDREIEVPVTGAPQIDDFEIAPSPSAKPKPKTKIKRKSNFLPIDDTIKEMWKLPFEVGWGREIVFRATTADGKRTGDVYYFSPEGKKFRSAKEIEKFLVESHSNMSVDCFTFRKEPVFKEPFEIIRNAKGISARSRAFGSPGADSPARLDQIDKPASGKKKKGQGGLSKEMKSVGLKVKFTKASFSPHAAKKTKGIKSPVMVKSEPMLGGPEVKSPKIIIKPAKSGNVAKKHTGKRKPMAVLMNGSGKKPKMSSQNGQRLCDLTCGQSAPSLHCEVCMCLFHPKCVGFTPKVGTKFVCQSCNDGEQAVTGGSVQPRIVNVTPGVGTVIQFSPPTASLIPAVVGAVPMMRTPNRQISPVSLIKAAQVQPLRHITPPPIKLNIPSASVNPDQISGQLITLPPHVTNKLNLTKPLNLKLNGQTYNIPPKCFIATNEGVKVLLPPGSLPDNIAKGGPSSPLAMSANSSGTGSQQLNVRPMVDAGVTEDSAEGTSLRSGVVDLTEDLSGKTDSKKPKSQGRTAKSKSKLELAKSVCHFNVLHAGFDCMIHIFQYLGVTDLLRVQLVCKTWCSVASQSCLWKTLRLRNVKVTDWEAAANYMAKQRTQALDLRIMAHPNNDPNRTWHQLHAVLGQLKCVRQIEFSQCPSSVLHAVTGKLSNLQLCIAEYIVEQVQDSRESNAKLDMGKFSCLTELECLKLRGVQGLVLPAFSFSGGLLELGSLVKLKTLALTTLRDLPANEFQFLGSLTNLETLEMGDTMSWSEETFAQLGKLTKLKHLRLEAGGSLKSESLGEALKALKELSQLELINFMISEKLADCLAELNWLKVFSVWPNKEEEVAPAVNSNLLKATSNMSSLKLLEWGVMNECSSENESFIPLLPSSGPDAAGDSVEVSLLTQDVSINELIKRLSTHLPDTKIRVFKVPGALIKKACPSRGASASPSPEVAAEEGASNDAD